jgi:hypothetical protein
MWTWPYGYSMIEVRSDGRELFLGRERATSQGVLNPETSGNNHVNGFPLEN